MLNEDENIDTNTFIELSAKGLQYEDGQYIVTFTDVSVKDELLQQLEIDTSDDDSVDSNIIPDKAILSDIDSKNDSSKRNVLLTLDLEDVQTLSNNPGVICIEKVCIWDDDNFLDIC